MNNKDKKVTNSNFNVVFNKDSFEKLGNSGFVKGRARIAYAGKNRNYTEIPKEAFENAMNTLANIPLVGNWIAETDNFGGHDMIIEKRGNDYIWKDSTVPYGVVPESHNAEWIDVEDDNGNVKKYLECDVILWQERYPEQIEKVINGGVNQSMEVMIQDGEFDEDYVYYIIKDFRYSALCLLGRDEENAENDVEPCFEDAEVVVEFSKNSEDFNNKYEEMVNKFSKYTMDFDLNNEEVKDEEDEDVVVNEEDAKEESTDESFENQSDEVSEDVSENDESQEDEEKEDATEEKENHESNSDADESEEKEDEVEVDESDESENDEEDKDEEESKEETQEKSEEEDKKDESEEDEDFEAKYNQLVIDYANISAEVETLNAELESLREFKNEIELKKVNEEKDEIFSKFSKILSEEDMSEVFASKEDISVTDLETKLSVIFANKQISKKLGKASSKEEEVLQMENLHTEAPEENKKKNKYNI